MADCVSISRRIRFALLAARCVYDRDKRRTKEDVVYDVYCIDGKGHCRMVHRRVYTFHLGICLFTLPGAPIPIKGRYYVIKATHGHC